MTKFKLKGLLVTYGGKQQSDNHEIQDNGILNEVRVHI